MVGLPRFRHRRIGEFDNAAIEYPACIHGPAEKYLPASDAPDRRLLLSAFAAQEAIEWPALDALLAART